MAPFLEEIKLRPHEEGIGSLPIEETERSDQDDGLDGDDGDEDLENPPVARLPPEAMVPQLVSFGPAASLSFEQVQQRLAGDHEPADGEVPTLVIHRDAPPPVAPKARVRRAVVAPPLAAATPEIPQFARGPAAPPSPLMVEALKRLKDTFHIKGLRPGQAEIIESVLAGRDTLAVMPTGSGKSLTYQLPSMVLPGPTLVVSPLLALIEDQVTKLKKL